MDRQNNSHLRLFKHYKKKYYQYLGEVLHSETLEKLVYYKTRHQNELGNYWVRPKDNFFGRLHGDGESQLRFERVNFQIEIKEEVTTKDKNSMVSLLKDTFDLFSQEKFETKLSGKKLMLTKAHVEGKFAGFKLGYQLNEVQGDKAQNLKDTPETKVFYSWLGAVKEEFQGLGLGQELMNQQHFWCRENGFQKIQTKTKNQWKEMICLNIKNGFDIIGTEIDAKGELKILLEKNLKV